MTPQIRVFHLEMHSFNELNDTAQTELAVHEACIAQYRFNRFMYEIVGADWNWQEKKAWSAEKWRSYAERDTLRTWVAYYKGSIAGYYELEQQPNSTVELKYFGLTPAATGRGFGRDLLTRAITSAWQWGNTQRLWVHTCSDDHPHALANYQARGFNLFKEELVNAE